MNINELKSVLNMNNLYFRKCAVERGPHIQNGGMNATLVKSIESTGEHKYAVELTLTVEKEDLHIEVVAHADFLYDGDDSREESIVQNNTVAIMYPFVRSQVSLMTSQPGMTPVVLPAIDTSKLK